jgi:hypothetical protein
MSKKKLFRLGIFVIPVIFLLSQCFNLKKEKDTRGNLYAGSETCVSCHKNTYNSYLHTAHFMASQPANSNTVLGNFAKGSNEFHFGPNAKVVMDKRDSGFYQTSYVNGKAEQSHRFDISFGGIKGQTYAYWFTNELFQLPISYITNKHTWINSPGYAPDKIMFERGIGTQCLDCHASDIKRVPAEVPGFNGNFEGFEKSSLIYGVDCERCHGPAAAHVKFHIENPKETQPKYIATFKSLTRDQKINMCAICHSGLNSLTQRPTFDFKPRDTISKYLRPVPVPDYTHIDVHGNQRGLLATSKCFINSNMDCSSCHDTHVNDRNNVVLYTARCMTCHSTDSHNICKLSGQISADMLKNNCISCHMPALPSKVIIAGNSSALIHTHHIAIYPDQTQKILTYLKKDHPQGRIP